MCFFQSHTKSLLRPVSMKTIGSTCKMWLIFISPHASSFCTLICGGRSIFPTLLTKFSFSLGKKFPDKIKGRRQSVLQPSSKLRIKKIVSIDSYYSRDVMDVSPQEQHFVVCHILGFRACLNCIFFSIYFLFAFRKMALGVKPAKDKVCL